MLLDILIIGGLTYGLAKLLNATAFKSAPAALWLAWALTVVVLITSFFGLFMSQVFAYKAIAADVGVPSLAGSGPKPNFVLPFLFAWLFFASLNKKRKHSTEPAAPAPNKTSLEPSPQQEPIAPVSDRNTPTDRASGVADRLKQLEYLRQQGFVTEAEYESKRKAIIDQI